jgi:hypothetical protein
MNINLDEIRKTFRTKRSHELVDYLINNMETIRIHQVTYYKYYRKNPNYK